MRRKYLRRGRQWTQEAHPIPCEKVNMGEQGAQKDKKKLDKVYSKRLTKRAKDRVIKRVDATEPSDVRHQMTSQSGP